MAAEPPPVAQECVEGYVFSPGPLRLLILRRPPARGGFWVPVSGKVEPTDADWEAALRRELGEETGIRDPVRVYPLDWEVVFEASPGAFWRLHGFAVELAKIVPPVLSDEHDAYEWVTPEEAIQRLHYEDNQEAVRRLRESLRRPPKRSAR